MNVALLADTGTDFGHPGKTTKALASFVPRLNGERASFEYEAIRNLSGLTFEVTGRPRLAVGSPVD